MKVNIVQLENIRSHVKSTVPFARGFNCLVGGLGCGKSSILYAIDFVLFGDPVGRSYEYLLREGADSGRVVMEFTQNGEGYRICRGLRRRGKGISQDADALKFFEDEKLIASIKSEAVAEQVQAITGLDKELFREIVWVRQEHLKELLDAQPRERQKRLDELFGLADYEVAWSSLAIYARDFETEKRMYEKDADVAGMDKLSNEYNRTIEEFSRLEVDLQDLTKQLDRAKKELDEADSSLKQLEEVRTQTEELKRKVAQMRASLSGVEDSQASLNEKIEGKKRVIRNLKERLGSLEVQIGSYRGKLQEAGISSDQSTESLRQYLLSFDDKIAGLKAEQESAFRHIRENQRRIASLSNENLCPLCLQNLKDEYKDGLLQRIQAENTEGQSTVSKLQGEVEEMQKIKSIASSALSNLQALLPRADDLKTRISDEEEALAEFERENREKEEARGKLQTELEAVQLEIGRFDVSLLDEAKANREQAFKQYYSLEADLRTKENGKKELGRRLDEVKERIDLAQQKVERTEKLVKAIEIVNSMRDAYRSIQPKLRSEFVKVLRNFVQQILDNLVGGEGTVMNVTVDESYTPYVLSESGVEREVLYLSGGERTLLAFAYRLGLGQLIMQSRTGHGLSMLLLDEPTESLGREDGSIDRLAEAISRFKAVEQIIAVTHSDAFAEKAEHVIRLEKEAGESKVSIER